MEMPPPDDSIIRLATSMFSGGELRASPEVFAALVSAAKDVIDCGVVVTLTEFASLTPESRLAYRTAKQLVDSGVALATLTSNPRIEAAKQAAAVYGDEVLLDEIERRSTTVETMPE